MLTRTILALLLAVKLIPPVHSHTKESLCCMCDCGKDMMACPDKICHIPQKGEDATELDFQCIKACIPSRPMTPMERHYLRGLASLVDFDRVIVYPTGPERGTLALSFKYHPYEIVIDHQAKLSVLGHELIHQLQYQFHLFPPTETDPNRVEKILTSHDDRGMVEFVKYMKWRIERGK
jgi:hypothetical protein